LLKRHFPDLYREKIGTEVHVSSMNNNTLVEISEERRQQIIARTRELLEADDKAT
jgi:ribosomal protein S11